MANYDDELVNIIKKAVDNLDMIQISNMIQKRPDLLYKEVIPGITLNSFIRLNFPDLVSKLKNFDPKNPLLESLNIDENQKSNNEEKFLKEELFEKIKDLIKADKIEELEKSLEKTPEILLVQDKEKGNTLLIEAIMNNSIRALEVISKKSKEEFDNKRFTKNPLDIQNNEGDTALTLVAKNYNISRDSNKMMEILLNNGASINTKNKEGNNTGMVLLNQGLEEALMKLMESYVNREIHKYYPEKSQFSLPQFFEERDSFKDCNFDSISNFYHDKNSENSSVIDFLRQHKSKDPTKSSSIIDNLINLDDLVTNKLEISTKPRTSITPRGVSSFELRESEMTR